MKKDTLFYAIKNGKLVYIDDVENGLACGCICPACNEPLIAHHGKKQIHHFSHKPGSNCIHGYETSLHLLAKEILLESKFFLIPPVVLEYKNYKEEITKTNKTIKVINVEVEKSFMNGAIRPDIVITTTQNKMLLVEIYVTHKIDEEKKVLLSQNGISTIEIDLSKEKSYLEKDQLKDILLTKVENKKWIYNKVISDRIKELENKSILLPILPRPYEFIILDCPKSYMVYDSHNYAVLGQCEKCKYSFDGVCSNEIANKIKQRIISNEDFKKIALKCIGHLFGDKNKVDEFKKYKNEGIYCPICGSKLEILRYELQNGNYHLFSCCNKHVYKKTGKPHVFSISIINSKFLLSLIPEDKLISNESK